MTRRNRCYMVCCTLAITFIVAALAATRRPVLGASDAFTPLAVKTPDGLTIRAQVWGNATGPEILFIHGFSQSYLSWRSKPGAI